MSHKIPAAGDEAEIADLTEAYLADEEYTIYKSYSARDALACIETTGLDLAILDGMLPDIDGFALCKKIRETHTWPIIMRTVKDAETDKIIRLTLGADDYVTKPFRPLELAARVKSQLCRYKKYNPARAGGADVLTHGGLPIPALPSAVPVQEALPVKAVPAAETVLAGSVKMTRVGYPVQDGALRRSETGHVQHRNHGHDGHQRHGLR